MNEHNAEGLTRRQVIAGATAALAGLTVTGKMSHAQPPGGNQQPETKQGNNLTVKKDELEAWTVDLATSLTEGKSLVNCLTFCAERTKNDYLRQVTNNILGMVLMGYTLSDVMELNRTIFNRKYVTTVRYGEIYGTLDETLEKMVSEWRKGGKAG